jgi:hypothetical protein
MKNRLLVSNLPRSATPPALREFFTKRGYDVDEIDFGPKEKWRLPWGYAVVTLSPDTDPWQAIRDTDGKEFDSRILVVHGVRPLRWRRRSERVA